MNVAHSEHPAPTWLGESVGHYEGGTLVIDTIGQKVGPLSMVDMYGTPFSAALHVIERYRLIDGATARDLQLTHESAYFGAGTLNPTVSEYGIKIDPDSTKPGLQVEITVDDPLTFTTPWSAFVTYRTYFGRLALARRSLRREPAGVWLIMDCPSASGGQAGFLNGVDGRAAHTSAYASC
jgi:hypothetical protein